MVTPRTARSLLVAIVAACIATTAGLVVFDAGGPVASRRAVTQPAQFHIPSYAPPGSYSSITIGSSSSVDQGSIVTLVPDDIVVTPAEGPAG
jgi:hypothetical protein